MHLFLISGNNLALLQVLEETSLYEFIDIYQNKKEYLTKDEVLKRLAAVETITLP